MRPISLQIEGINSFTTNQVVDFNELASDNIFCISGATGSGKTTILDCILLALYKSGGDRNAKLEEYVNLNMDAGKIDFVFELDDVEYESIRVISRQQSKNSIKLINRTDNYVVGEKAEDVFPYLEEKIGIGKDEFTSVVILQQGRFSKFLKATKAERNNILKKIFKLDKYDRLQNKFGKLSDDIMHDINIKDTQLQQFEGLTEATIKDNKKQLKQVQQAYKKNKEQQETLEKLLQENLAKYDKYKEYLKISEIIQDKNNDLNEIATNLNAKKLKQKELEDKQKSIKDNVAKRQELLLKKASYNESKPLIEEIQNKENELNDFRQIFINLRQEKDYISNEIKSINETLLICNDELNNLSNSTKIDIVPNKILEAKYEIQSQQNLVNEIQSQQGELTDLEKDLKVIQNIIDIFYTKKKQFLAEFNEAKENELASKKTLVLARNHEALASVVSSLKVGDKCPICGDTIKEVPNINVSNVKEAEDNYDKAVKNRELKDKECINIDNEIKRQQDDYVNKKKDIAKANEKIKEKSANIKDYPLSLNQMSKYVQEMLDKIGNKEILEKKLEKANKLLDDNAHKIEINEKDGLATKAIINKDKEMLKNKIGNITIEQWSKQLSDIEQEIELIDRIEQEYLDEKKLIDDSVIELEKKHSQISGEVNQLTQSIKQLPQQDNSQDIEKYKQLLRKVLDDNDAFIKEITRLENTIKVDSDNIILKHKYLQERSLLVKKFDNADKLKKIFKGDAFIEYLATEYIMSFTETASIKLQELSNGKYMLEYNDGDFWVLDFLSNNEKRKVRSLSGGETFLASLSIAIAISMELSSSRSYDFFFLDEGFGTLHSDALDTVANALYSLSKDTLVGVVTHREDLIDRLPKKLIVHSADENGGTTLTIG